MRRKNNKEIEVDEIFLDQKNTPGFHQENMEGMLENPIKNKIFWFLGVFLISMLTVFGLRVGYLQLARGEELKERSEKNYLRVVSLSAQRGIIYDKDGNPLAYNDTTETESLRKYPPAGFLHVLGFLTAPEKEGDAPKGASGLEATYDEILRGTPDKNIEEVGAKGNVVELGILEKGQEGKNILTGISKGLNIKLAEAINGTKEERGFKGGAGVFMDIKSGEILALASAPEFDPNLLSKKNTSEEINKLLYDEGKPFLNRAVSGLYAPGSIVKPALAIGALLENIITPDKKIMSTGSISLPNPYDPARPNIFLDWKAHGLVDMRQALAVSSDVYFYEIGGGYQDQKGLGPWNIKKYFSMFGFEEKSGIDLPGEKSGHLPDPSEKQGGRDWTIGNTYHMAIGQGDVTVTPIGMISYVSAIASDGIIRYPHLVRAVVDKNKKPLQIFSYPSRRVLPISPDIFKVIKEGMRDSAKFGTAQGLSGLPIEIAAKTGTAEVGGTNTVHSWSIGFFPYENPRVAFVILMEGGPRQNTVGATYVATQVIRWITDTGFLSKLDNDILPK
ncbi:MAG: Cell division protein ftsi/penicillin-binding protein 2 [Candidatus Giovannonibacteria bacterium GW2011_GWC2_43_8]|nr:MAG: Cell division protein ftsi/penicillin-binding protein 2 [Candidatus Giovannonibacteria bacterium GW2011_GWC2_43_8]